jgi:hypothetical protein
LLFKYIKKSIRLYREFFFYLYLRMSLKKNKSNLDFRLPKYFKSKDDYDKLFFILNETNENNEVLGGTRVIYEGYRSTHGYDRDGIEGTTRFLPYLASYILTLDRENPNYIKLVNRYIKIINNGIFNNKFSWGKPEDYDQLICETADIALSLWLSRDFYWDSLDIQKKDELALWLKSFTEKKVPDNNWYLFILTIEFVLKDFGYISKVNLNYFEKIKSYYISDGWFRDGENGDVDLYSIWGFHYSLFWISIIDPFFCKDFIQCVLKDIYPKYHLLFNNKGYFYPFGRSKCYRMSIVIPMITSCFFDRSKKNINFAANFMSKNYSHFLSKGAIKNGRITQGVYKDDISSIDYYTGPGSPLWSLRPLIIANYMYSIGIDMFSLNKDEEINDFDFSAYPVKLADENIEIRLDNKLNTEIKILKCSRDKYIHKKSIIKSLIFFQPYR